MWDCEREVAKAGWGVGREGRQGRLHLSCGSALSKDQESTISLSSNSIDIPPHQYLQGSQLKLREVVDMGATADLQQAAEADC